MQINQSLLFAKAYNYHSVVSEKLNLKLANGTAYIAKDPYIFDSSYHSNTIFNPQLWDS